MPSVRIVLDHAAIRQLLTGAEIADALDALGQPIAARANAAVTHREYPEEGEPFRIRTFRTNAKRAITVISTNGYDGEVAEATHRALSRAIG
jgi:hypothetical protein